MANTVITSSMITNETLRILHNESIFLKNINREYNDQFAKSGAKAGSTVNVRRPVQYTVRSGPAINIQDVTETQVPITLQPEFGIDWAFSDYDLTTSIDDFSARYLMPAGKRLATELDSRIASLYTSIWNFSGAAGTPPTTAALLLDPGVKLHNSMTPTDDRYFIMTPNVQAGAVAGLSGLFNSQSEIGNQYSKGMMGNALGYNFGMSQTLPAHTAGVQGGASPTVTSTVTYTTSGYATTSSVITGGWSNSITNLLRAGDVVTFAGCNQVNQETKADLGILQQFVVTASINSTGGGAATLVVSPAIITGGAYQNVTAAPAATAAVVVKTGTSAQVAAQNLVFHKDAFTLVTCDMELPNGMDMAQRANFDGVSLRFIRGYDITNNRRICRFDILAGYAALRPEWACRIPA
jgi:hypothetical protein